MSGAEVVRSLQSTARKAASFAVPNVQEQALLGFLLGALYGLGRAIELGYEDRTGRSIDPRYSEELRGLLAGVNKGQLPPDGQWLAGFFFNSALHRLTALYHRCLKVLMSGDEPAPKLAEQAVRAGLVKRTEINALATVHKEVNKLKHDTFGVLRGRSVDLALAVNAGTQALSLMRIAIGDPDARDA